jgi:mannose-6-phosphate isomerase
MVRLYPFTFEEYFVTKPWGGDGIRKILRKKAGPKTGESWELVCRKSRTSIIKNGLYRGKRLDEIIAKYPREILGDDLYQRYKNRFPLIIKFVYAKDRLSLQVHPSDTFVIEHNIQDEGKMEAWYVVDAKTDAKVVKGVIPGIEPSQFATQIDKPGIETHLNIYKVNKGDVIFIPPGTIHSAWGEVLMLEVQQNSDVTFRLTDWEKRGRPVDLDMALKAADFYSLGVAKVEPVKLRTRPYRHTLLVKCQKFTMELIEIKHKKIKMATHPDRFKIIVIINGRGVFHYSKKSKTSFKLGQTFLIPAYLGDYEISCKNECQIVLIYV